MTLLKEKVRELIKKEYRDLELVFEENESKMVVYEYIEPFIKDGVQDDHKGRLNNIMEIDKVTGEINGVFAKKEYIREEIKKTVKKIKE